MKAFISQNKFIGGTLAVMKDDRLVFARAYTRVRGQVFEPIKVTSLFRIASCSKPITCVGIYQLLESKALSLDSKVQDILNLEPPDGLVIAKSAKPANLHTPGHYFHEVTIEHLLTHRGGWHPRQEGAPAEPTFFKDPEIVASFKHKLPVADTEEVARWGATQPMQFFPGFEPPEAPYSNFGYLLLGLVIQKVTGLSYETAIKQRVFGPIGVERPILTRALKKDRAPGEVTFHYIPPVRLPSMMHEDRRDLPVQYGGENYSNFAGFGGWSLAAVDYARFLAEIHREKNKLLVTPAEDLAVWGRGAVGSLGVTAYGHGAGFPGSQGDVAARSDGVTIAAFFNSTKSSGGNQFTFENQTFSDHLPMWHAIADGIADNEWPQMDLFPKFFGPPKEILVPRPEELLTRVPVPKLEPPDFRNPEFLERRSGHLPRTFPI